MGWVNRSNRLVLDIQMTHVMDIEPDSLRDVAHCGCNESQATRLSGLMSSKAMRGYGKAVMLGPIERARLLS